MPAMPVRVTTDVVVEGRAAVPVYVDPSLPTTGGPARAVVVVTSGPYAGGAPQPVAPLAAGPVVGPALPVYVVSGFLGPAMYDDRLRAIAPASLIAHWGLNDASGPSAIDDSGRANHGVYAASGITYGAAGIGDGQTGITLSGSDTYVNIPTATITFDTDWNGNAFSMVAWGKVDGAARWTDGSTFRYLMHIRANDATYYAVLGKNQTNHQLEWRRRSGGAIVSTTYTFSPSGPLDWFCMGMTCQQSTPALSFYLNDSVGGWRKLSTSNSASLTTWGNNPPIEGASVLGAGSLTLQEWIGGLAHGAVWNTVLTDDQMRQAMTLPL